MLINKVFDVGKITENLVQKTFGNLQDYKFLKWEPFGKIEPFIQYNESIKNFIVFMKDAGSYTDY